MLVRPPAPADRVRFVHDLFRATVYEALDPAERAGRHRAAAETLRRRHGAGHDVAPAELAAHYLRAGTGSAAEAARYSALAGDDAAGRLAYEDASAHFERALTALDDTAGAERLNLLLRLGAAHHGAGRAADARASYRAAADAARALADPSALATAALGAQRLGARTGTLDADVDALLAEAIAALDGRTDPKLAPLLAARARTLHHGRLDAQPAEATRLAERAVRLARDGGDPATIAACLLALHDVRWRPGSARDRLSIVDDMVEQAHRAGDADRYAQARQLRAAALIEIGDPRGVAELATYCRLADDLGYPHARWNALTRRATLALITGDNDAARELIPRAAALGVAIGEPDALGAASTQAFVLTILGEPPPALDRPSITYGRRDDPSLAALVHHSRGDRQLAAAVMSGFRFADSARSHDAEPLVLAAFMVSEYGPDDERREAYARLLPLAGTHSLVGGCATYQGAIDHHLAALAAALGWPDKAAAHVTAAVAMYERLGAPRWVAQARELSTRPMAVFRRDGELWTLAYRNHRVHVADAKGLRDLAVLLAAPGRPVHVRHLQGSPDAMSIPSWPVTSTPTCAPASSASTSRTTPSPGSSDHISTKDSRNRCRLPLVSSFTIGRSGKCRWRRASESPHAESAARSVGCRHCGASTSTRRTARSPRWSGPTAPARRHCCSSSPRCSRPTAARSGWAASTR